MFKINIDVQLCLPYFDRFVPLRLPNRHLQYSDILECRLITLPPNPLQGRILDNAGKNFSGSVCLEIVKVVLNSVEALHLIV